MLQSHPTFLEKHDIVQEFNNACVFHVSASLQWSFKILPGAVLRNGVFVFSSTFALPFNPLSGEVFCLIYFRSILFLLTVSYGELR